MSIRAILLFCIMLLVQAGQGMSFGLAEHSVSHDKSCAYGCCAESDACCCLEAPESAPAPHVPASLPASGRDRAPSPVMILIPTAALPQRHVRAPDVFLFRPSVPRLFVDASVSLTVLHCAFLI
jgi:hypothetical protein